MNKSALLALALALSGCAAGEKAPIAQARLEAAEHNRRGVRMAETDRDAALEEFALARKQCASVEDSEGAALALLNGARVARFANRTTQSRLFLEQARPLLKPGSDLFPELLFEQSKLALSCGDLVTARGFAEQAVAAEKGEKLKGRLNLLARIEFLGRRYSEAEAAATRARAIEGNPEESANSDRIMADLCLATGRTALARQYYLEALSADRRLGKSAKIAADLKGLARAAQAAKEPLEAVGYQRRAAEVHLARGERVDAAAAMKEAAWILESIGRKQEGLQAQNLSEEYLNAPPASVPKGGE